jgi:SAM-dependent methyltransferase
MIRTLARRLGVSNALIATIAGYRWHLKRHYGAGRPLGYPNAPWRNAVLRNRLEWETATTQVKALGLPSHPTASKNWDSLAALACILQSTPVSASILDAGAALYSVVLPWLFLYGYRNLIGINQEFDRTLRRGPIRYERGDITQSRFGANTFDVVVCQSVLEHGVDVPAYLKEMARILRPGGLLITSVDYYAEPVDTRGQTPDGLPYRVFTRAEVSAILSAAESRGLGLTGPLDLACEERAVEWTAFGLAYTYLLFTLRKNRL